MSRGTSAAGEAVFVPDDGRFHATELARGPWDVGAQHGGPPAALLVRAFEQLEGADALMLARLTFEFVRPVPLAELIVDAQIAKPGRRVQLLEGSIQTDDGTEVVRARALRVQQADLPPLPQPSMQVPGPERARPFEPDYEQIRFAPDAVEIRFVSGHLEEPGPATAWLRLRCPLVAGETASPLQRLVVASDFGNGVGSALRFDAFTFVNPDLTLYVEREPTGEWICLQAETHLASEGIGVAESVLYDERGQVGRAAQALLIARRPQPISDETP
jgi:Acyl-CoA thioesterase C-terminal domain/Acyl-CoA thioesterase N-terminal domain